MADDTVEKAKQALLDAVWRNGRAGNLSPFIDALIAAVRAENDRKDREHPLIAHYERLLAVECTCRMIEKCQRCEAIDALDVG